MVERNRVPHGFLELKANLDAVSISAHNSEKKPRLRPFIGGLLSFVSALLILSIYMHPFLFSPNQHTPAFGGDGLTIHYNLQYHATWGTGSHLTSQYYPHGETIYMTDAQGVLAYTLAKLRNTFPKIHESAVGISNALIYWSTPLAALILFFCLIRFKVRYPLAIVFGVLIALLAPQIHRQTCGHYALGYAFLLPLTLLYLQQEKLKVSYLLYSIGLVFILVILGLNNPYLLAIATSFILGACIIGALLKVLGRSISGPLLLCWLLVSLLSLGLTNGILASLDNVPDRVEVPAGFFENVASVKGVFFPDESLLGKPLTTIFKLSPNSFESRSYIGIVPLLSFLFILFSIRTNWTRKLLSNNLLMILGSGILVLFFAFGFPFNIIREWSLDHLGKILQFRAPGRFSWVFYYSAAITGAVIIDRGFGYYKIKYKGAGWLLIGLAISIWGLDVHQYLTWRTKGKIHHNTFAPDQLASYKTLTKDLGLSSENYHGLYLLPTEHGWTDKVMHHGQWRSNYEGYRLSMASGLPLLNGKMSRMSVDHTLASMQLVSHPFIKRTLLDTLTSDKELIFLQAQEFKLDSHLEELLAQLKVLHQGKNYILYSSTIEKLKRHYTDIREKVLQEATNTDSLYFHLSTEENKTTAYAGSGCSYVPKGNHEICTFRELDQFRNDSIDISFWNKVDKTRPGGPRWAVSIYSGNNILSERTLWALDVLDTHQGWLRISFDLKLPETADRLVISSKHHSDSYVDEILIRRKAENVYYSYGNELFCNNILIE